MAVLLNKLILLVIGYQLRFEIGMQKPSGSSLFAFGDRLILPAFKPFLIPTLPPKETNEFYNPTLVLYTVITPILYGITMILLVCRRRCCQSRQPLPTPTRQFLAVLM